MTQPHQTIIEILTIAAATLTSRAVVLRASGCGYTQDAVRSAISDLIKAGKIERHNGDLSIKRA